MKDRTALKGRLLALQQSYAAQLPDKIGAIESCWRALQEGHWDQTAHAQLHQLTHSLAGSGGTFGYTQLSQQARAIEELLKDLLECHREPTEQERTQVTAMIGSLRELSEDTEGAQQRSVAVQVHAPPGSRCKIYLVLDDVGDAQKLTLQVSGYGYDARVFATLHQVHMVMGDKAPGAVILDISSPEAALAHAESIGRIRHQRVVPLPVIFISSRNNMQTRLAAVRAGGDAYFTKPLDVASLVNRLDELTASKEPEPYRILVVDDEKELAAYHQLVLRNAGMTVQATDRPLDIMALLVEFKPDLILMDVYMPECSGLELAKVIRQQDAYMDLPIVFLSTEQRLEKQYAALNLGGDDFLTKPIEDDHLVAAIVHRAKRARLLGSAMVRDGLTQLLNHNKLKEQLEMEVLRANRHDLPMAFAMLDLDHFKEVNDTYGHLTGDRVLKNVARFLLEHLRRTDIVGRYGGEEFAVIFPNTNEHRALAVLEQLRALFAQVTHAASDKAFSLTLSGGVAGYPRFQSAQDINRAADEALYRAKGKGRNHVVLARPPDAE